jgi:two-component system chemotaxis response regulator CheB
MREAVSTVLSQEPGFTVVTAADPLIAMIKMSRQCSDVIVLDLEMPRMGGITFLRKIMIENPIPVVVCSVHVGAGAALAIEALEAGAVYVVSKPQIGAREFIYESAVTLIDAVRAAAKAKARIPYRRLTLAVEPALSGDAVVQQTARPGQLRAATRLLLLARPLEARRRCGSSSKRCPQMLLVS